MDLSNLYAKALQFEFLYCGRRSVLFNEAPLTELMYVADPAPAKTSRTRESYLADRPECQYHECLHCQLQVL